MDLTRLSERRSAAHRAYGRKWEPLDSPQIGLEHDPGTLISSRTTVESPRLEPIPKPRRRFERGIHMDA